VKLTPADSSGLIVIQNNRDNSSVFVSSDDDNGESKLQGDDAMFNTKKNDKKRSRGRNLEPIDRAKLDPALRVQNHSFVGLEKASH